MLRKVLDATMRTTPCDGGGAEKESWIAWLQMMAESLEGEIENGAVADWVVKQRRRK